MYGRKSPGIAGALLFFLSLLYSAVVRLRTWAYDAGLLPRKRLPLPVISVGNITVGGTGKTPAVIEIAAYLRSQGKAPVVLSRGYGRTDGGSVRIVSDSGTVRATAETAGDEPFLIASRLPGVSVVVGPDRYAAGMTALRQLNPDVAVLDDGFQHLRLHRDLNILLLDATAPFGNGRVAPAGILREPVEAVRRADIIVLTRADQVADRAELLRTIGALTAAPVFFSRHVPVGLVSVPDGAVLPLSRMEGRPVVAFSGIARPEAFLTALRGLNVNVREHVEFTDHHRYSRADMDALSGKARAAGVATIITTEKDAVKAGSFGLSGLLALRIGMEIEEKDLWEKILRRTS